MSALKVKEEDEGTHKCCKMYGGCTDRKNNRPARFEDTWKLERGCKNRIRHLFYGWVYRGVYGGPRHILARASSWQCYDRHLDEVEKQAVSFWEDWLAPIPLWLNNVVLMQQIEVSNGQLLSRSGFVCSAL